ncbi:MAG: hypothetical protein Q7S33_00505, partial [Nanoarchaeota archaeon]|nr:hypothetical protein [Nanoarchaeota archaeon]
ERDKQTTGCTGSDSSGTYSNYCDGCGNCRKVGWTYTGVYDANHWIGGSVQYSCRPSNIGVIGWNSASSSSNPIALSYHSVYQDVGDKPQPSWQAAQFKCDYKDGSSVICTSPCTWPCQQYDSTGNCVNVASGTAPNVQFAGMADAGCGYCDGLGNYKNLDWSVSAPTTTTAISSCSNFGTSAMTCTAGNVGKYGYSLDGQASWCKYNVCNVQGAPWTSASGQTVYKQQCDSYNVNNIIIGAAKIVTCTPQTCINLGKNCGTTDDGCGTSINCGSCASGTTCSNGVCILSCTPKTCAQLGKNCGTTDDGCGTSINCGSCASGSICDSTAGKCNSVTTYLTGSQGWAWAGKYWYSGNYGESCDSVCSRNGKTCSGTFQDDSGCNICKHFYPSAVCARGAGEFTPAWSFNNICWNGLTTSGTPVYSSTCSATAGTYARICACETIQVFKSLGASSSAGTECASGYSVDGVCCNSACSGTCQSCNIAGKVGTCSNDVGGTSCGTNLQCDANGACNSILQTKCSDCGIGWLNVCDQTECLSLGSCYFSGLNSCNNLINAQCGTANTKTVSTKPLGPELCSATSTFDTNSFLESAIDYKWKCLGSASSLTTDDVTCSANKLITNAVCGTANTKTVSTKPLGPELCSAGTFGSLTESTIDYKWNCLGSSSSLTSDDVNCYANKPIFNGVCGTADGQIVLTKPTATELCTLPSTYQSNSITESTSDYKWICVGSDSTKTTICHANKLPLGASSSISTACASGYSADGVCCNSACSGACQSCNIAGKVGTCSNNVAGTDSSNECSSITCTDYLSGWIDGGCWTYKSSTSNNGQCNGLGACSSVTESCTGIKTGLIGNSGTGQCNIASSCVSGSVAILNQPANYYYYMDNLQHGCASSYVCGSSSWGNCIKPIINGACGTANGQKFTSSTFNSLPTINLCSSGTVANKYAYTGGTWGWDCMGINGGTMASCYALQI